MPSKPWRNAGLTSLLLLSAAAVHVQGQTVTCSGISAWSATTTYAAGTQVTYQNGLYKALVSTTNVPPNYCPACGWWQFVGNCGSTPACTTVAGVPTGLASSNITTTGATVSWSAVSTPANCTVTYNVYRDGTQVATGLSGTSTALSGLTANTTYAITVASVDAAGTSAKSTALSVKTLPNSTCTAAPSVPTGLTSPSQTTTSVNLTWTASTAGSGCTVSYKVYQGGTQVATPTTNTATISGLTANTTYSFTVASVDSYGTSAQSSAISVKTQPVATCAAAPSVPTGLNSPSKTSSSVNLSWSASTAGANCTVTYNVYKNNALVATVPTTTAVISGLAASTAYNFSVAAVDQAGTSAQSAALSVTTSPASTTNLPKRIMSGYWHTWGGGPGFIKLRDVDTNWDVINVAFAAPVTAGSTDGHMTFAVTGDASYTDANFKADIKTLQAKGKKIVLSIGGYEGYFSLTSASAVTTFVNDIKGFVSSYGFDGIDIDLEQTSIQLNSGADPDFKNPTSPKVVNMISAINQICSSFGSNFILSWAPETFYVQLGYQFYAGINPYVDARAGDYLPMIYALRDKTTYVQVQLYNSGAILAPDGNYYSMGDAASIVAMCKMLLQGFNVNQNASYFFPALRPDQVVIAVPASSSAAGSGQVSNATLQQAFGTLNSSFPGLRGIMAWSINWDNFQNANSFVDSNRAYLNTLP